MLFILKRKFGRTGYDETLPRLHFPFTNIVRVYLPSWLHGSSRSHVNGARSSRLRQRFRRWLEDSKILSFLLLIPLLFLLLLRGFQPPAAAVGQARLVLILSAVSDHAETPPQLLLWDLCVLLPPAAADLQGRIIHGRSQRSGVNLADNVSVFPGT